MQKKNGRPIYSPIREPDRSQPDRVHCRIKPECEGCPFPGHGFICWSADGSCLRTNMKAPKEGEKTP